MIELSIVVDPGRLYAALMATCMAALMAACMASSVIPRIGESMHVIMMIYLLAVCLDYKFI
jgi:hypothetical protein